MAPLEPFPSKRRARCLETVTAGTEARPRSILRGERLEPPATPTPKPLTGGRVPPLRLTTSAIVEQQTRGGQAGRHLLPYKVRFGRLLRCERGGPVAPRYRGF